MSSGDAPLDLRPVLPWRPADAFVHERVQAVIDRVELRRFRYPVRWKLTNVGITPVCVSLMADVLERESGAESVVLMHSQVPLNFCGATDLQIGSFLFRMLNEFLRHEAAEAFHLSGVRVFDPHVLGADPPASGSGG